MKKYYLHSGTEQTGPFDISELKAKNIGRETPIWFEGLPDWTTAQNVDELQILFAVSTPPPFHPKAITPPTFQNLPITHTITDQPPIKNRRNDGLIIVIIVLLVVVAAGVFYIFNKKSSDESITPMIGGETYQEKVMTVKEIESSKPKFFLTAEGRYDKNLWGNKIKIHGIMKNTATVISYKNAVVRVTFYSNTKTKIGNQEYPLQETFPPGSETKFVLKIDNIKDIDSIGLTAISAIPE